MIVKYAQGLPHNQGLGSAEKDCAKPYSNWGQGSNSNPVSYSLSVSTKEEKKTHSVGVGASRA